MVTELSLTNFGGVFLYDSRRCTGTKYAFFGRLAIAIGFKGSAKSRGSLLLLYIWALLFMKLAGGCYVEMIYRHCAKDVAYKISLCI